jgi:Flp pilus assembly protein TadD
MNDYDQADNADTAADDPETLAHLAGHALADGDREKARTLLEASAAQGFPLAMLGPGRVRR